MKALRAAIASAALAAALSAAGAAADGGWPEWENAGGAAQICGMRISPGYLRGKVVVLDFRDYADPASAAAVSRLQAAWKAFMTRPFVVLGCHTGEGGRDKVKALVSSAGATYPVCEGVKFPGAKPPAAGEGPLVYVFDAAGWRKIYKGEDDRGAVGAASPAILAVAFPPGSAAWKAFLDFEFARLPGRAFLRMKALKADPGAAAAFAEKFPEDFARFEKLHEKARENADVKRLAKLVSLAALAKDCNLASEEAGKMSGGKIDAIAREYADLKSASDPFAAQEAKNALYDLKFAKARLENAAKRREKR